MKKAVAAMFLCLALFVGCSSNSTFNDKLIDKTTSKYEILKNTYELLSSGLLKGGKELEVWYSECEESFFSLYSEKKFSDTNIVNLIAPSGVTDLTTFLFESENYGVGEYCFEDETVTVQYIISGSISEIDDRTAFSYYLYFYSEDVVELGNDYQKIADSFMMELWDYKLNGETDVLYFRNKFSDYSYEERKTEFDKANEELPIQSTIFFKDKIKTNLLIKVQVFQDCAKSENDFNNLDELNEFYDYFNFSDNDKIKIDNFMRQCFLVKDVQKTQSLELENFVVKIYSDNFWQENKFINYDFMITPK